MFNSNETNIPITATDKTSAAFASAKANLKGLSAAGSEVTRSLTGMFGSFIGISAFVRLTKDAIAYGSSLTDAATATRTTVEAYQVLKYVAQDAGADMDKVTMALAKTQKAANDAKNGLTTYTRAFDALGINVEDFRKLAPERQFETLGRAYVNSTDKATAYASILDIIGSRNAPRLLEVLERLGRDGFDANAEKARNLGQVMSNETAQAMDDMADAMERLKTKFKNGWSSMVVDTANLIPGLRNIDTEIAALGDRIDKAKSKKGSFFGLIGLGLRLRDIRNIKQLESELDVLKKKRDALLKENGLPAEPASPGGQAGGTGNSLLDAQLKQAGELVKQISEAKISSSELIKVYKVQLESMHESLQKMDAAGQHGTLDYEAEYVDYLKMELRYQGLIKTQKQQNNQELEKSKSLLDQMSQQGVPSTEDVLALMDKANGKHTDLTLDVLNNNQMMLHSMQQASDGMAQAFVDFAMTGKANMKDFASSVLQDMARMLIQMKVINPLMNTLFGKGDSVGGLVGGFFSSMFGGTTPTHAAVGASARAGMPYLIGTQDKELFVPSTSGTIIPGNQLGGGSAPLHISFNVTAFDSASFDQGLAQRRRMIVGMVDEALNKRGRRGVTQ